MLKLSQLEVWFVTGSQHLYGQEALAQVAAHSQQIAAALGAEHSLPFEASKSPRQHGSTPEEPITPASASR